MVSLWMWTDRHQEVRLWVSLEANTGNVAVEDLCLIGSLFLSMGSHYWPFMEQYAVWGQEGPFHWFLGFQQRQGYHLPIYIYKTISFSTWVKSHFTWVSSIFGGRAVRCGWKLKCEHFSSYSIEYLTGRLWCWSDHWEKGNNRFAWKVSSSGEMNPAAGSCMSRCSITPEVPQIWDNHRWEASTYSLI